MTSKGTDGQQHARGFIAHLAAGDWQLLRAVRLAALRDCPASFSSTLAAEEGLDEAYWRRTLESGATFVARQDSSPVGMAAGIVRSEDTVGLAAMWVATAWRGLGVADDLVRAVLAWADDRHAARLALWALTDDERACRFYRRHGFISTGVTRTFPSDTRRTIQEMALRLH